MVQVSEGPLALSTPDENILGSGDGFNRSVRVSGITEDKLYQVYEIERTIREVRHGRWRRIALQFPDEMLVDAARIVAALEWSLQEWDYRLLLEVEEKRTSGSGENTSYPVSPDTQLQVSEGAEKFFILADTSYGACCVDEIAAEHVDADVVVHYGRACLSPTARLPVIYVFTSRTIPLDAATQVFIKAFPDRTTRVILMADVMYANCVKTFEERLRKEGYNVIYSTAVIRDPSSPLPNRTVPEDVQNDSACLSRYGLFHISQPPASLLLTLASRVASIHIFPSKDISTTDLWNSVQASTFSALRRRYALITSLSTVSIFGILINTLSVKSYLHIMEHVKKQIAAAGKKSYTFVMGKVNAAKLANFSEVGGWVVIGCWESSLIESKDFWKPVITPFELQLALQRDEERVWTGQWSSDFSQLLHKTAHTAASAAASNDEDLVGERIEDEPADDNLDSEPESAPPEFDLRSGRYVSHSRLMQGLTISRQHSSVQEAPGALMPRRKGDLTVIGGQVSPGAEFLRSKRTWRGLGSDVDVKYDDEGASQAALGASMEQGRTGIAKGYRNENTDRS